MNRSKRKECYFSKKNLRPDYKDANTLQRFLTPWSKIKEGKDTGVCAKHQRILGREIKRARYLALLPYTSR